MKKRIIILLILLVAILGIVKGIKTIDNKNFDNSIELDMYFLNDSASSLVSETRVVGYDDGEDVVGAVVESLIDGPSVSKNTNIADRHTKLNSITKDAFGIVVDFSPEFMAEEETKTTLSAYAVVKTLCQISGVNSVKITINSNELLGPDGTPLGFLSGENINLERDKDSTETKNVVLYFKDATTGLLAKETRTIKITDTQPIEHYIITELIKGPDNKDSEAVLSADTSFISAETTDGTCFVNFGSSFLSKNSGDLKKESIAIYSIVNSLTELDSVKSVQFLVDGKKITDFGSSSISLPFTRNNNVLK